MMGTRGHVGPLLFVGRAAGLRSMTFEVGRIGATMFFLIF
jgi:hypothetical protein